MKWSRTLTVAGAAVALAAGLAAPAGASTFVRAGLDELVDSNGTIVVAEVLDAYSYWNDEGNFIFTDIRLAPSETLKGRATAGELTVTLMGGTVGETTVLVLGAPVLVPGGSYVLFLNPEDLPGRRALTVRDQLQGAFEIVDTAQGPRARSQALDHPLVPDLFGVAEPPGGREGFALDHLTDSIRAIVRSSR